MDIKKAREMLAAATAPEPSACQCPGRVGHGRPTHETPCAWFEWMFTHVEEEQHLRDLALPAWAALILAVEALGASEEDEATTPGCYCGPDGGDGEVLGDEEWVECFPCLRRKALAAWEAL